MALRRVFVESIQQDAASVSSDKARHLARVARLRRGEEVEISDGQRLFLAKVTQASAVEVRFEIVQALPVPERPVPIVLQAAIFKFSRFDWIVEKATELGVAAIVPVESALTDRGLAQAARKRRSRWQKIAEEAAQQSRRLRAPSVEDPIPLEAALASAIGPWRFFLHDDAEPLGSLLKWREKDLHRNVYLLVGPEGGWTEQECRQAHSAGYRAASLGSGILRAETAALAAISIASHLLTNNVST